MRTKLMNIKKNLKSTNELLHWGWYGFSLISVSTGVEELSAVNICLLN